MTNSAPLLSLRAISVSFGDVRALDSVDLELNGGEIRAVLGENGAGKSTLMNVAYGLVQADAGSIEWRGQPVEIDGPHAARALGIGMVHQEFALIDALSVTENLAPSVIGPELLIDYGEVRRRAIERANELGLDLGDLEAKVGSLPVGVRQRIEILKAMLTDVRLLILDEPTAVLTPFETEQLFAVLGELRQRNVAILLITHKLSEVMQIADAVTILRGGRLAAYRRRDETSETELAELMVGQSEQAVAADSAKAPHSSAVLRARGLCSQQHGSEPALSDIDLDINGGEILGIAGVDGNGQQQLFDIVSGLAAPSAGTLQIDTNAIDAYTPAALAGAGVSTIAPDRRRQGAVLDLAIWENAILDGDLLESCSNGWQLDRGRAQDLASTMVDQYSIVCDRIEAPASSLSGGNLQKLIVARAMATTPRLLVAFNPTRGLDIGAQGDVWTALHAVAAGGGAVLLISTDLDEILGQSDRVAVLFDGQLASAKTAPFDRHQIGLAMGGASPTAGGAR